MRRLFARLGLLVLVLLAAGHVNAQTFTSLLSFTGNGGAYPGEEPYGSLTVSGTTLYGMTAAGGSNFLGNVFSVGTNGSGFQNLLSFYGSTNPGDRPNSSLTLIGTTLYGMTGQGGGGVGGGNVFSIGTNGSGLQNLLSLSGGTNGAFPGGSLTMSGTTLFGMTSEAGYGDGNVFSIGTNGSGHQNLLSFSGTNGTRPYGSLTLSGTTLFGMTFYGGSSGDGNVFSIGTNGSGYQNLLSFSGSNGEHPNSGCLTLSGTTLFGMTSQGGSSGDGNVFSVGTNGSGYQNLLSFSGSNGSEPEGSLILSGATLFGMTELGGSDGDGNVFSIGTNGNGFDDLLDFTGDGGAYPGAEPYGDLTLSGSTLFGMTSGGGANGDGSVFSVTLTVAPEPSTLALLAAGGFVLLGCAWARTVAAGRGSLGAA